MVLTDTSDWFRSRSAGGRVEVDGGGETALVQLDTNRENGGRD